MKLAITSAGKELEARLDPRFGRAAYFIIVDLETMTFEAVENSQSLNLPQGAGIQAGKTLIDHHVDVLITGHCGPKAFKLLQNANIKVITSDSEKVTDAIARFSAGKLKISTEADVESHWV